MKTRFQIRGRSLITAVALCVLPQGLWAYTVDAVSREYSAFNFGPQSSAPNGNEAISREFSVFNYGSNRLSVAVGSTVIRAGTTGSVPLTVSTIVPITNLAVAVDFPPTLLSNWMVLAQPPYAASLMISNNSRLYLNFSNATFGQTIQNSNVILAQIEFASAGGQPSAFLPLPVADVNASLVNAIYNAPSQVSAGNGEVAVIWTNALLRAFLGTNGLDYLKVYGSDGTNYTIQSATNLVPPITWQPAFAGLTPSNLVVFTTLFNRTNPVIFYRAVQ